MEKIKGKSILVGKDPQKGNLQIAIEHNGKKVTAGIGQEGCVPNCVSRCYPAQGVAHCQIDVKKDGSLVLRNLKPQNVTFVNGAQIESKSVNKDAKVTLGGQGYPVSLTEILNKALELVCTGKSIKHLKDVWNGYENKLESIQLRQQNRQKKRLLPMVIGSASGLIAPLLATMSGTSTLFITVPIAVISFVIYICIYNEKDTSVADRKKATNDFIDAYVCPYDECKHYLGNQPYKVLRQNKCCPYCKKEWNEE